MVLQCCCTVCGSDGKANDDVIVRSGTGRRELQRLETKLALAGKGNEDGSKPLNRVLTSLELAHVSVDLTLNGSPQ